MNLFFNWRIVAAVIIAITLAASHYKAYHAGGASARADLLEMQTEMAQAAAKASEDARAKETLLNVSNERIRNALAKEKAARAADAAVAAGRLRDFQSTLDSASRENPSTGPGADGDPRPQILAQCASQLIVLDQAVKRLASQTRGLQAYAVEVCLSQ